VLLLLLVVVVVLQPPFDGEDEDDLMASITDYGVAFPRFMSKESVAICSAVSVFIKVHNKNVLNNQWPK